MTEQEKRIEKQTKDAIEVLGFLKKDFENKAKPRCKFARVRAGLFFGIKALEEVQAYRAIGTVEEIKKTLNDQANMIASQHVIVKQYSAVGTVEEFKALKEKQTPKKPLGTTMAKDKDTSVGSIGRCPCCDGIVAEDMLWCDDCGQKLDWELGEWKNEDT